MRVVTYGLGLLLCLCATDAMAYDPAGHMYTANLITHMTAVPLDANDAAIITFCTQLPDESSDLDASAVYYKQGIYSGLLWDFGHPDMDVQRMVTVQQLIHGLTGGDAGDLHDAADDIVTQLAKKAFAAPPADRPAALCALGFAVHLYGDSYAHKVMAKSGQTLNARCPDPAADPQGCMYATGLGHAKDLHFPDWPLCAYKYCKSVDYKPCFPPDQVPSDATSVLPVRFEKWMDYGTDLAGHLHENGTGGAVSDVTAYRKFATDIYCQLEPNGPGSDDWEEADMQLELEADKTSLQSGSVQALPTPDGAAFLDYFKSTWRGIFNQEQPCEAVLAGAFARGILEPKLKFSCLAAWCNYYPVSKSTFTSGQYPHVRDPTVPVSLYTDSLWQDSSGKPTSCEGTAATVSNGASGPAESSDFGQKARRRRR